MTEYRFLTRWRVKAPPQRAWDVLNDAAHYPDWWPCYKHYRILTPGVAGVGAATEYVIRGALPYNVCYRIDVTHCDPPRELGFSASGDLVGVGRMVYQAEGAGTLVTFHWHVRTTRFWLNLMAPPLRRLFAWNHNWVMRQGEQGLVQWLGNHAGGDAHLNTTG